MLTVIGIGPGSQAMMTMEAVDALQAAEIIVGYKTYTHLVKAFTGDKQVIKTVCVRRLNAARRRLSWRRPGIMSRLSAAATPVFMAWRDWCWSWSATETGR